MTGRWILLIIFLAVVGGGIYALLKLKDEIAILGEFFEFLKEKKLWWIAPIMIVLILLGVLIFAFQSGAISSLLYVLF
ncbi:hypothetical protein JW926_02635 [Candidatus Sumerlaeota bacterium]|nr:hypothetical protein [Candidatus Sumerlaeota bacterium]